MSFAMKKHKSRLPDDRKLTYFRRTRKATWILAFLFGLGAALTENGNASTESFYVFAWTMAAIFFVWGLDAHVRIRRTT